MSQIQGTLTYGPPPVARIPGAESHCGLQVSFVGRIDNRRELAAKFALRPDATDTALIAAACRQAGDDSCFASIVGDFAIVIWDESLRRLTLGRDCFGVIPLYYHRTAHAISWSSDPGSLVNAVQCSREPDSRFVAGFLTFGLRGDVSPFKQISSVPPAGEVCVTPGGIRHRTYWRLDPRRELRLKTDADYEERFREVFREAVRDRMETAGPVFCELSGGLDSSAIAGVADEICRNEARPRSSLQTVSHIYEEASTFDDRPYILAMEATLDRISHRIDEADAPLFAAVGEPYPFAIPSPAWVATKSMDSVNARMAAAGSTVLLSGIGGDHLCWSEVTTPPGVVDDLSRLRWIRAFRKTAPWVTAGRTRTGVLIEAIRELRQADGTPRLPWVDRRFLRSVDGDRANGDGGDGAPSKRRQLIGLSHLAAEISLRSVGTTGDIRFPFLDRRLVELAFSIPADQYVRPDQTRSLQRRAMSRFLPAMIGRRETKGGPSATIYRRFRQQWPTIRAMFKDARVCDYGYAEPAALDDSLQRAAHGQNFNASGLLRLLSIEAWLRAVAV